jgi:hypothetical protein
VICGTCEREVHPHDAARFDADGLIFHDECAPPWAEAERRAHGPAGSYWHRVVRRVRAKDEARKAFRFSTMGEDEEDDDGEGSPFR